VRDESPLVSCLCVTEDRPAFMPWLLWGFDRQTWPAKELVIVDSSAMPFSLPGRDDVRVLSASRGARVASKRNLALAAATGAVVAWFDDDDWQHPLRLETSVAMLHDGAPCAGPRASWMLEVQSNRVWRFPGFDDLMLFNGSAFLTEAARSVMFDPTLRRASDTLWLEQLRRSGCMEGWRALELTTFFWLVHGLNLSVSARRITLRKALTLASRSELERAIGAYAWSDTDHQLTALSNRLTAHEAR
jgi:hypothetical protein